MIHGYSLDPHPSANVAKEKFAVVLLPRIKRERLPAVNVEIMPDLETALEKSNPSKKHYAAKVVGPASSSEGFKMYYIVEIYNA
jgi:hypothetical protein